MKRNGYQPFLSLLINSKRNVSSYDNAKIICCGKTVFDISDSAEIELYSDLIVGDNLRKGSSSESFIKLKNNSRLIVNERFQVFFGASIEIFENASLTLGKGYINTGGAIACAKEINIGNGVFIGRNTYITDSDHHRIFDTAGNVINEPKAVNIGDHVLIGFGAAVLKGVTIGDGAVIAAGAVVTRDIPSGCLAAGVPAKVIKEGIIWK